MSYSIQADMEQDALEMASDVVFDRWTEVRQRFDKLSAPYAAAVALLVVDTLKASAFDREPEINRFKRFLLEVQ